MFQPIIKENFLDKFYFQYLYDWVHSYAIEWKFNKNVSKHLSTIGELEENDLYKIGCSRGLYDPSKGLGFNGSESEMLIPAILKMEETFVGVPASCIRARLDMTFVTHHGVKHNPHTDHPMPHWTAILYFSDTDGDTIIYNERRDGITRHSPNLDNDDGLTELVRITPKKNQLVFFDGLHYHTGHSPTTTSNRILLNVNFNKV